MLITSLVKCLSTAVSDKNGVVAERGSNKLCRHCCKEGKAEVSCSIYIAFLACELNSRFQGHLGSGIFMREARNDRRKCG